MKITKRQLRRVIREAMRGPAAEMAAAEAESRAMSFQPLESFKLPYRGTGYGGRRIISRDRAWLEFVPRGSDPLTSEDMFRAVTLLEIDDPEISKALQSGAPKSMGPLDSYDVYSVYATTTG